MEVLIPIFGIITGRILGRSKVAIGGLVACTGRVDSDIVSSLGLGLEASWSISLVLITMKLLVNHSLLMLGLEDVRLS